MVMTADANLLIALKDASIKAGVSPGAFISLGEAFCEWRKHAVPDQLRPPYPRIDAVEIDWDVLSKWPSWVTDYLCPGQRSTMPQWERMQWPDGSVTVRLVDRQGLVLGARHFQTNAALSST